MHSSVPLECGDERTVQWGTVLIREKYLSATSVPGRVRGRHYAKVKYVPVVRLANTLCVTAGKGRQGDLEGEGHPYC